MAKRDPRTKARAFGEARASYEMIEQYFPNVPKIELNCRGKPRPGWDAWGNEVEEAAE